MAIIRIKRTTTTNLPTGLTFGELAFVQGSGATANRLYIQTNNAGVSVWVGAEILNSPTYWSGTTAETTVPTVSAVRSFVSGFVGATVFPSDIVLNLSDNKSFGKYTTGQTLPAAGKTPIEVITDALVEYILLGAALSYNNASSKPIPYGVSGNVSLGLTYSYILRARGFTAIGATLEWQKASTLAVAIANSSGWTSSSVSGSPFYDTTSPFSQLGGESGGGFTGSATHTANITWWDPTDYHYRYTVRDSSGNGFTYAYATIPAEDFTAPSATISSTGVTGTATLTGVHVGEVGTRRERGNTGTSVTVTFNTAPMDSTYHKFTEVGMQYTTNNGTNWYGTNNTENSYVYTAVSPNAASTTNTFTVTSPVSPAGGIASMKFRFSVKGGLTYTTGRDVTVSDSSSTVVSFRKRIFYGPTASVPTTAAAIRSLPFSFLGPTSGTAISVGSAGSTFAFNTGTQYSTWVIALPRGLTLNAVAQRPRGAQISDADIWVGKDDPATDPMQRSTTLTTAEDVMGVAHDYNVYTLTLGDVYSANPSVTVAYNGTAT